MYVPKGEGAELTEEQQRKKSERQSHVKAKREERQSKYVFDKTAVTLETVVPELPKKTELITKPVRE
jgi:hypothetical protein